MSSAGFVLAGGQSTRMGRNKALLPWRNGVLVQEIAGHVKRAAGSVALVGDQIRYAGLPFAVLPDLRACAGPLSGVEAALASGLAEFNLIVACDMPNLQDQHLGALLRQAVETRAECLITLDQDNRRHPLCAVYRSTCLPVVSRALDNGRLRLLDLLDDLKARAFPVTYPLLNVNTPAEWMAVQETDS
jgi:molybdenum cofactor guanylyltransferase